MKFENLKIWLFDSGCTDHINNDTYFERFVNSVKPVDARVIKAKKIEQVEASFSVFNHKIKVMLPNAYYVAAMNKNLISYAKITNKNKVVSNGEISKTYNSHNELIAITKKEGNLYKMSSTVYHNDNKVFSNVVANNLEINTSGHINLYYLDTLAKTT